MAALRARIAPDEIRNTVLNSNELSGRKQAEMKLNRILARDEPIYNYERVSSLHLVERPEGRNSNSDYNGVTISRRYRNKDSRSQIDESSRFKKPVDRDRYKSIDVLPDFKTALHAEPEV
jgi:hypothetical protein